MCASAGMDPWRCVAVELIIYCSITSSSNRATNNNFPLHRFLSWISKAACCRKCVAYNVCIFAGASKEFSFCFGRILFSRERVVARRRFLCVIYDGYDAYFIRLEQKRRGLCAARANNAARFKNCIPCVPFAAGKAENGAAGLFVRILCVILICSTKMTLWNNKMYSLASYYCANDRITTVQNNFNKLGSQY